jgi:hypothetical protein
VTLVRALSETVQAEMSLIAASMRRRAAMGTWDGRRQPVLDPYFRSCVRDHDATGTRLILTRDVGHHASGWFKNPDYERCLHLSVSSYDLVATMAHPLAAPQATGSLDWKIARLWAEAVFGKHLPLAWVESPKSDAGKERDVWHWRLFCDEHWQPLLPRGEVYTLDFTEKGWKTHSQVVAEGGPQVESLLNPHAD